MDDRTLASDIHLGRMIGWALNTLGKAVAISVAVTVAVGIVMGLALPDEPAAVWLAALAGPLTFGGMLYNASPPLPYTREELGSED